MRVSDKDRLEVDGVMVRLDKGRKYYVLNKPVGVVTTVKDPEKRTTVIDLIGEEHRVYPVGRLDIATEGLVLLMNDGELAQRLMHPSSEVPKTYIAEVRGVIDGATIRKLVDPGVKIDRGRPARAISAKRLDFIRGAQARSTIEIKIHEGRKHVVRLMLEINGFPVSRLVRMAVGPIRLGRLMTGTYRALTPAEVDALYREVGLKKE